MTVLAILRQLLPAVVTVLYAVTAACYLLDRQYAWSLVWGAYAAANVGLILAGR